MSLTDEQLAAIGERFNQLDLVNDAENAEGKAYYDALGRRALACAWDVAPLLAEIAEQKTTIEWAMGTIKRLKQEIHALLNPSSGMDVTYEGTVTIGEVTS